MGPNLKRLFDKAKCDLYFTQEGMNVTNLDVMEARTQLECLLHDHGEALIAALEKVCAELERHQPFNGKNHESVVRATTLLAQLEREAQP